MMNEKHVIAEMLYDTITRYENMLSRMAALAEADKAVMDAYEKKLISGEEMKKRLDSRKRPIQYLETNEPLYEVVLSAKGAPSEARQVPRREPCYGAKRRMKLILDKLER